MVFVTRPRKRTEQEIATFCDELQQHSDKLSQASEHLISEAHEIRRFADQLKYEATIGDFEGIDDSFQVEQEAALKKRVVQ